VVIPSLAAAADHRLAQLVGFRPSPSRIRLVEPRPFRDERTRNRGDRAAAGNRREEARGGRHPAASGRRELDPDLGVWLGPGREHVGDAGSRNQAELGRVLVLQGRGKTEVTRSQASASAAKLDRIRVFLFGEFLAHEGSRRDSSRSGRSGGAWGEHDCGVDATSELVSMAGEPVPGKVVVLRIGILDRSGCVTRATPLVDVLDEPTRASRLDLPDSRGGR